jgi:hypothetical protein
MAQLASRPCLKLCRWLPSRGEAANGLPLFRCLGCGSEWVRTEPWTPVDADGGRDRTLQAEVDVRPAG